MKRAGGILYLILGFVGFAMLFSACGPQVTIPAPASPAPTVAPAGTQSSNNSILGHDPNSSIRFERIGLEQGLSQSVVNAILQDKQGFMWFGTEDGLNRYDGYNFKVYRPETEDTSGISDRWINSLVEDGNGYLWIGTRQGGLNRFDPRSGLFTVYRHDPAFPASLSNDTVNILLIDHTQTLWVGTEDGLDRFNSNTGAFDHFTTTNGLSSNIITALYEDHAGTLWIGTAVGGLNRYNARQNTFDVFKYDAKDNLSLSSNRVTSIAQDKNENLWVGTSMGLNRFEPQTNTFTRFVNTSDQTSLGDNIVSVLYLDHGGRLWVGTNNGLDYFNDRSKSFSHYRNQPADPNSLSNNTVFSIAEDNSGVLWVGTYGGGLDKYDRQQDEFTYLGNDPSNENSLSGNMIFPIYTDLQGFVWIGTYGNGLNRYDPFTKQFTHYRYDPQNANSLSSDEIYSVYMDQPNSLWVGTSRALDHIDLQTGQYKHYRPDSNAETNLSALPVYIIYKDRTGNLWFGTSKGLDQYEPDTDSFIHYNPVSVQNENSQVVAITEDHDGQLWIGTFGSGLHRLRTDGEGFVSYFNDPHVSNSLSNNSVWVIHEDRQNNLWIGTGGGGLDRYNPTTDAFTHYTERDGLPSNVIYGMLEDDQGDLWLSTNYGLSRFDPQTGAFRNFTAANGLQSNEFNMSAYAQGPRGEMYFGGINGVTSFQPQNIKDNPYVPPIQLTSLTEEGKTMETGTQVQAVQEITLNWPHNSFEFEFAALAYGQPSKNQYAYKLMGFDQDWNNIGNQRNGRYTNLPGGTYTLLLKGSNSDGVWNDSPRLIKVIVVPPFWQTTWFRILAGLLLAAAVAGGYRLRLDTIQRRNRALEKLVLERTHALEKRTLEMEALYQADEKILRTVSINQVFQALVDVAVDILQADRSAVFAWNEDQARAVPRVSHGFSPKTLAVLKFAKGEGMVGKVLATGEPVLMHVLQPEDLRPDIREAILEEGIHSLVHLPIKVDNRIIGVFNVGFTRPGAINEDIVRVFTALVQRASMSIANMQLFEQTKDLAVMEERNRLARDLHDSAKQKAFAALAQLGTANGILNRDQAGVKPHLNEAENLVYEVIQELTFLIQEIYPIALQEKGLSTTLREYIFEWENRNDIAVNLTIRDERPLDLDMEQAIYRIIQESLANVARHSQASRVDVSIRYHSDSLEVSIADNGRGFDINQKVRGMGLRSIRDRVGSIRGSIQIQSAPNHGTRVLIQVPLKNKEMEKRVS